MANHKAGGEQMSEIFDIDKFSQKAQQLTDTLEKTEKYIGDVDAAMTRLHEEIRESDIHSMLEDYNEGLAAVNNNCQNLLQTLNDEPRNLKETALKLTETTQQMGDSYAYLDEFRQHGARLIELLESLGHLDELDKKLSDYEAELAKTQGALDSIRKQQMEIEKIPNVMKSMKESVMTLQDQYLAASHELMQQGKEAAQQTEAVKEVFQKNENLQKELQGQVKFFTVGIYAIIVMNTLMMVFLAIFLIKEIFFSA